MLCFKIQKRFRFFFKYTHNKANVFVPGSCLHTPLNIIHQFLCGVQNHRFLRTRYLPHPKFILILQVYFILKDIKTLVINLFSFTPSFIYKENKFHYKDIFQKSQILQNVVYKNVSESFLKTFQQFCWSLLKYLDYSKYCWNSDVQWSQFQNIKAVSIDVFIIHWNVKFYSSCSLFEKSHRNFFEIVVNII